MPRIEFTDEQFSRLRGLLDTNRQSIDFPTMLATSNAIIELVSEALDQTWSPGTDGEIQDATGPTWGTGVYRTR